jgi:hypothetical protein
MEAGSLVHAAGAESSTAGGQNKRKLRNHSPPVDPKRQQAR